MTKETIKGVAAPDDVAGGGFADIFSDVGMARENVNVLDIQAEVEGGFRRIKNAVMIGHDMGYTYECSVRLRFGSGRKRRWCAMARRLGRYNLFAADDSARFRECLGQLIVWALDEYERRRKGFADVV